ncbi:hypothetical protein Ae201684P_021713 [Aphanomyces euteiches]|nr:hypothetical protein Ae201684P_021713 [Aphanomyces euteiches]
MDEATDDIVQVTDKQRFPLEGEPVCVFCGRYGEYICDKTDEDVCSVECRDKALERAANRDLQKEFGISVTGAGLELPLVTAFRSLNLHDDLYYNMQKEGYHHPTPVQMQVLPYALQHHNLIVTAPTGTGKTMAYLIPLVTLVMEHRLDVEEHRILGLVLAPIRELCVQLEEQAKTLMKGIPKMKTALLVGGVPIPNQLHRLSQGVQLVIATPGRLHDLVTEYSVDLSHTLCCVLDEVDMLLEKDFAGIVVSLLKCLPDNKQFILVSATIDDKVHAFAAKHLHQPIFISIAGAQGVNVHQSVHYMAPEARKHHLFQLLQDKCSNVDMSILQNKALTCWPKQSSRAPTYQHCPSTATRHSQRLAALNTFVEGTAQVLVSTFLLGRGMDLLQLDEVVVFDLPPTAADYIHLIGRAGRNGAPGAATVYICAENAPIFGELIPILRSGQASIPHEMLEETTRQRIKAYTQRKIRVQDESKRAFRATTQHLTPAQQQKTWRQWTENEPKRKVIVLEQAETQHKKFKFIKPLE